MYYLKLGDLAVVGSSPEMLVRVEEGDVFVRPIAGTRRRGRDAAEDEALAEELLHDEKELAEHVMLVRSEEHTSELQSRETLVGGAGALRSLHAALPISCTT